MKWIDKLDEKLKKRVLELQSTREEALYETFVLDGSHEKARKIIAACNREIEKIAEGVA